ncbi:putative PAS/PAC sensor protein [Caldithrix abyssi DSM 13497]|uniref:histidine kinase n=1 Tax=Caldithrix abyssi DSM 13497 TaxID=880073 RepID=H1XQ18_CALAY|nr:PAS domain S-box protein [Caldithrix abyssi]APF18244.1 PAS domain S-box-containing protein [Caldithrix abyssi DSM 13497]EHO42269.1 putative PAS/PAC sensor protein [Caldithrix abyssi DSM 13497]
MAEQLKQTTLRDYQTTITILEHLTDAIFILKPDGAIQYANHVACDLLGLPLSQILKNNLNNFLHPPFLFEENEKSFLEQIYQHSILELERTLKHGSYATPVVISFGFVRNNQDEVDFIIASARDVSVRKNLEKELYQQQLYAQSRDRYKELGELAINIVHRLSQPITSIRLLVEMMQKKLQRTGEEKEQFEKNFTQITLLLNEMNEVITNIRNFAFLTEEEKLKPVDLLESLGNALQHLQYELTEHDVEVFINKDKQLPLVPGNPLNIQQAFTMLLRFYLNNWSHGGAAESRKLQIDLINMDEKWVELRFYEDRLSAKDIPFTKGSQALEQNFSLAVAQLMVTSSGGDFRHLAPKNKKHAFMLRFPAAHSDDRQQLLNMIDMMK